jgi:hypothetical protein
MRSGFDNFLSGWYKDGDIPCSAVTNNEFQGPPVQSKSFAGTGATSKRGECF